MIENWNTKIYNMHKDLYKFVKKRNKCNMTIKSIITKGTINKKIHKKEKENYYYYYFDKKIK